jgi:hypothetical protein
LEASLDFPDVTQTFEYLVPNISTVVTNVTDVSSIASVLLPPSNIRVYHLEPLYGNHSSIMGVIETTRLNDSVWSPPTLLPNTMLHDGNSPITASAVNVSSAPAEIHLLFMNGQNQLAKKTWDENGWKTGWWSIIRRCLFELS